MNLGDLFYKTYSSRVSFAVCLVRCFRHIDGGHSIVKSVTMNAVIGMTQPETILFPVFTGLR